MNSKDIERCHWLLKSIEDLREERKKIEDSINFSINFYSNYDNICVRGYPNDEILPSIKHLVLNRIDFHINEKVKELIKYGVTIDK